MALSDFQITKLKHVYSRMYDSNKDGLIDEADFVDVLEKISTLHHWGKNDVAYKEAQANLAMVWDGLKRTADKSKDDTVKEDEWIEMWTRILTSVQAGQDFPDWQKTYVEFIFSANDTSGDGFIDRGEYITIQLLFGSNMDECERAWKFISEMKDNFMISIDDFRNLWKEYLLSNDKENRANYLFGLLEAK